MPNIARKTADSAGGAITSGSATVFVNGFGVARHGDSVANHGLAPHASATLVSASRSVFVNGIRAAATNNSATCGHAIIAGSPTVLVGG